MNTTPDVLLKSWAVLNQVIGSLREDQIKELIFWELEHKKRPDIVERLHQRFSKLVAAREREELLSKCKLI